MLHPAKTYSLIPAFLGLAALCQGAAVTLNIKMDYFGYRPADTKIAIFTANPGATVEVRDLSDTTVFTVPTDGGSITSQGFDGPSGDNVWWVDFGPFATAGTYRLYVPSWGTQSYDFEIREDIYNAIVHTAIKTFYYQRCGTDHPAAYAGVPWADPGVCHSYLASVGPAGGQTNHGSLDLSGGWHDAGDYNKYMWSETAAAISYMLRAYEENPGVFSDGDLTIPESGNGVPDILDEVQWEIDWILKMQRPTGQVLNRVWDAQTGAPDPSPPSNAVHSHGYYTNDLGDSEPLKAAAVFVGTTALAARIFEAEGDPYGNVAALKTAANLSWTWLLGQGDHQLKVWAAAELFRMDNTVASAQSYVNGFHPGNWSGSWLYPYFWDTQAALTYVKTAAGTASVQNNMRNSFNNTVNGLFSDNDKYRNGMVNWAYHWGSNNPKAAWGHFLVQAALSNHKQD